MKSKVRNPLSLKAMEMVSGESEGWTGGDHRRP
jgi:hypothetical protein